MEAVLYSLCKDESKTWGLAQSHRAGAEPGQSRGSYRAVAGLPVGVFSLSGLVHLSLSNEGELFHASPSSLPLLKSNTQYTES